MFLSGATSAQDRPRIFVTDSQAWSAVFSFGVVTGTDFLAAGSSPQTVEVIDDFAKHCPAITVTFNKDNADYIVLFDRDDAGKPGPISPGQTGLRFSPRTGTWFLAVRRAVWPIP